MNALPVFNFMKENMNEMKIYKIINYMKKNGAKIAVL